MPIRNEALRLPDFLRHYREIGIDRFVMIDNGSDDGTLELLEAEPDVDLYSTDLPYPAMRFGATIITFMAHRYGTGRWIIYADADEHLVYDGVEDHGLRELTAQLERQGRHSLPAMMLDMYGGGAIADSILEKGEPLVSAAPYFDSTGYVAQEPDPAQWARARHISYEGGPRSRLFKKGDRQFQSELAKTPLVKWTPRTVQYFSHSVFPMDRNFGRPTGCLLHFKYLSDFRLRTEEAISLGTFYNGSAEAKSYRAGLQEAPDLSFHYAGSRRYDSSKTLVDLGLMTPINWD
ncbi:MAG: glycosyltransferase family 2 protein [Alphaproteobacteria bacterium]